MTKEHLKILKIISIILVFILVFLWYILINKIRNFETYHRYFSQDIKNQKIENWMTINQIERIYHIDLSKVIWEDIWFFSKKESINKYCTKEKIDCNKLILELNKIKNGH